MQNTQKLFSLLYYETSEAIYSEPAYMRSSPAKNAWAQRLGKTVVRDTQPEGLPATPPTGGKQPLLNKPD